SLVQFPSEFCGWNLFHDLGRWLAGWWVRFFLPGAVELPIDVDWLLAGAGAGGGNSGGNCFGTQKIFCGTWRWLDHAPGIVFSDCGWGVSHDVGGSVLWSGKGVLWIVSIAAGVRFCGFGVGLLMWATEVGA